MTEKRPRGRPPKLGDHHRFVLRLPDPLHKRLLDAARQSNRSLNDLILEVLSGWADRQQPKDH
ncbi:toxin-antitoxin system HicB family antitoxin [Roseisolibacter agri]|uniref:toxin-antitoxin system HicB family antitoxin n=1 Tax=Roseisolibacter agri TaxID=2014610 RepID=UPI003CE5AEA8